MKLPKFLTGTFLNVNIKRNYMGIFNHRNLKNEN